MRDDFNNQSAFFDPNARVVNIPAHTVLEIDYSSVSDDARQGLLKGATTAQIEADYGTKVKVPEQAFAFTSWDRLPPDFPEETKALLKKAIDDDDSRTPDALKGRVVLNKPLQFKKAG